MNMSTTLLFACSIGMLSWGSVCAAQEYEFKGGYPTLATARRVQDEKDRPQNFQPIGDDERLERHCALLSPARRDSEQPMKVPGGAGRYGSESSGWRGIPRHG